MSTHGPEEGPQGPYSDDELKDLLAEDKRAKRHELPSFELVVREYTLRLYYYALTIVKIQQDAEDVIQEAFFSAYNDLDLNYTVERIRAMNLRGWLYTITRHEAFQCLKKRNRPGEYNSISIDALTAAELDFIFYGCGLHAPAFTDLVEEREFFKEVFGRLTENEQKAVILHFIFGMKYSVIAEKLNMSEEGVKALIFRARIKLRTYFERWSKEEGDES
jgi:RNA polymerase sigma-70 factor (ECF subfamily)